MIIALRVDPWVIRAILNVLTATNTQMIYFKLVKDL